MSKAKPKILFIGEGVVSDAVRMKLPGDEMDALGLAEPRYHTIHNQVEDAKKVIGVQEEPDVVVFSRTHALQLLLDIKALGKPVIVDMDDDFHTIPEHHPGYYAVGRGNPGYLKIMEDCIKAADLVTVTNGEMADRMSKFNNNILIIPNGWSSRNGLWRWRRNLYQDRFIIGWAGTITHREDFKICHNAIRVVLKKHENAMIHIGVDAQIYQMFGSIPETQKLFTPMVPHDLFPLIIGYWDILLAPLKDDEFNRAKSDIKLVEAVAKGIPYIASDIGTYQGFGGGVLVPESQSSWISVIEQMITREDLRKLEIESGLHKAEEREMGQLVMKWFSAIRSLL